MDRAAKKVIEMYFTNLCRKFTYYTLLFLYLTIFIVF